MELTLSFELVHFAGAIIFDKSLFNCAHIIRLSFSIEFLPISLPFCTDHPLKEKRRAANESCSACCARKDTSI